MSKNQKIFRRVLTIFLALILVLGCVAMIAPYVVSADDGDIDFDDLIAAGRGGYCGENATWKLNGRGVLTIGGTGAMDLNGNDAPWYSYRDEIVAIVVENGVTAIDDSSFMNLFEVTSVSLGKDVKSIGEYAFNCCTKLKSLTIPDSVKTIAEEAFGYCEGLRSVVIGNGVEEIEGWAFVGCLTLETVTIGSGYAAFEPDAFEMCPSLESVTFAATNTAYTSVNGAVYSKDKTALVYIPSGITGKFEILSTVAEIEKGALNDCYGLDSLTIPASVKKIERQSGSEMGIVETIYYEGNASTWDKVEKIECEEFFQDRLVFFSRMSITSQPKNAAAPSGSKATTKITATGEGLKYAWYIKNKGATTWSKSSLTGTEYYVTMKSTTNGRQVYCLVTDQYGNSVKSDVVTLYMGNPAKITTQPKSMTVQDGKQAKTTLKATGDGLKYTWYFKNKGAASFSKSSLTGTSYYVTMKAACDGRQVYCVVTDKYGTSVKSSVVTLSMVAKPKITTQPANNAAANGKTVTTTVKATGEGLKYTWYYKNPSASSYTKSSSTTATYSTTMKSAANGRQVYCVVTDKYGQTVKSNVATLYMGTPVKITTQPKNAVAGEGKTVTTTLKATGTGLKYTWYFKNASATAYSKSSVTTATYTTAMAAAKNGRTVYCVVTDKYGISVKSNVVTLYMGNPAKITRQPQNAAAPNGQKVTTSLEATGDGLTYAWYFKNKGASAFSKSSLTGNEYYVTSKSTVNGRQVYCVVTDKYGTSVKSSVVTLYMGNPATITQQPADAAAPDGQKVTTALKATGDGLKYAWYYRNAGTTTWNKSSLTGNEYYVTMKSTTEGRQVYCQITDKYGITVKSDVATLSMETEEPVDLDLSSGYWTCVTEPRNGKLNQYYMVASNEDEAYLLVYAYTTDASQDADINEPIVIDDVTYYNYGAEEHRMNFVRSGNTLTMTGTETNASLVVKLQEDYSVVLQSVSGVLNCEIMKAGDVFVFEAYPVYVEYITKHPENTFGDYGDVLTATVEAEGEGLTYLWYVWDNEDWIPTDQTTPTYTMTLSEENVGQTVRCRVTDAEGQYQDSYDATFDYIAPSAWGTFRYVKPTADKAYLVVAELNVEHRELHVHLWEPLAAGEEPEEGKDLVSDGIYYREPDEGWWRRVEMSVEDGLVKIAILEADEEVAAIYLERTDYYTMTTVRATGEINDIPGFVEMFAEGDLVTWY